MVGLAAVVGAMVRIFVDEPADYRERSLVSTTGIVGLEANRLSLIVVGVFLVTAILGVGRTATLHIGSMGPIASIFLDVTTDLVSGAGTGFVRPAGRGRSTPRDRAAAVIDGPG